MYFMNFMYSFINIEHYCVWFTTLFSHDGSTADKISASQDFVLHLKNKIMKQIKTIRRQMQIHFQFEKIQKIK